MFIEHGYGGSGTAGSRLIICTGLPMAVRNYGARIVRESSGPFKWTDMPDVNHGNRSICPLQEDPSQVGRKPCNVPPVFPDLDRPSFDNWLLYKF